MIVLFWLSVALILYTYAGYPALLWLRLHWAKRPVRQADIEPTVSIVIAARNEGTVLRRKILNLASLDYPAAKLQIVVASDGSTDSTNAILEEHFDVSLVPVLLSVSSGKPAALNAALQITTGEVVIFMDARQEISRDALRKLVRNFADPEVGCVSGGLVITENGTSTSTAGVGLYWKIEKKVRQIESALGSVVGVTGAIYAARRELVPTLPCETLLDDVYVPMHVARAGHRVLFEPEALAWDVATPNLKKEFRRKVRTLTGNYQIVRLAPWLITRQNPLLFEFLSHKLLRLAVPFAMLAALISSALLGAGLYRIIFWGQIMFYVAAALGLVLRNRLLSFASSFLMLNAAAALAFVNSVAKTEDLWHRRN